MKGSQLLKGFSKSLDRFYLWWTLQKSRVDHRPSSYDFDAFITGQYLDSPQLFYPKPREIVNIRFVETNRSSEIEGSLSPWGFR